jgi:hypothetical protein
MTLLLLDILFTAKYYHSAFLNATFCCKILAAPGFIHHDDVLYTLPCGW